MNKINLIAIEKDESDSAFASMVSAGAARDNRSSYAS